MYLEAALDVMNNLKSYRDEDIGILQARTSKVIKILEKCSSSLEKQLTPEIMAIDPSE